MKLILPVLKPKKLEDQKTAKVDKTKAVEVSEDMAKAILAHLECSGQRCIV